MTKLTEEQMQAVLGAKEALYAAEELMTNTGFPRLGDLCRERAEGLNILILTPEGPEEEQTS